MLPFPDPTRVRAAAFRIRFGGGDEGRFMARIVLLLAAAMFAGFGIYLSVRPGSLEALGIVAEGPLARTELRAFYGGLELGLAAFLALCAMRREWFVPGCLALALVNAGIATVRIAGLVVDGSAAQPLWWFLVVELGLVALALFAARIAARIRDA